MISVIEFRISVLIILDHRKYTEFRNVALLLLLHSKECKKIRFQEPKATVSVCADREIAYICADRVRSVGRLALQGIISGGAIFCVQRLQ